MSLSVTNSVYSYENIGEVNTFTQLLTNYVNSQIG